VGEVFSLGYAAGEVGVPLGEISLGAVRLGALVVQVEGAAAFGPERAAQRPHFLPEQPHCALLYQPGLLWPPIVRQPF